LDQRFYPVPFAAGAKDAKAGEGRPVEIAGSLVAIDIIAVHASSTLREDGLLIAIGDVSGKGMPAAMMVSLLVGTLHTLVETTARPGQQLAGLNRLVQGRSHDGFTTCLILRPLDLEDCLLLQQSGRVAGSHESHCQEKGTRFLEWTRHE